MIHRVGACVFVSLLASGCGVGDEDEEFALDRAICTDAFKVTGSLTPSTPRPVEDPNNPGDPFTGCWPVGTWNFTVTIDPSDENIIDVDGDQQGDRCGVVSGTTAATFDASYSFTVNRREGSDGQGPEDSYVLNGAVQEGDKFRWNDKYLSRLKVTEGGGGECEGGLELFSTDGKSYWNMKPALTGTTITGFGDFKLFDQPQLEKPQS
jgi:hypothetical protein